MPFRKRRPRFLAERTHHPIVAVIAKQHHADQCGERRAAGFTKRGGDLGAALRLEIGEGATRERREMRQSAADIAVITLETPEYVAKDLLVVGTRHAIGCARWNDHARERVQVADLFGGKVRVLHGDLLSQTGWRGAASCCRRCRAPAPGWSRSD